MKKEYNIYSGAKRLEKVAFSAIRAIIDKGAALKAQGHKVIPFSAGEPDFNTPEDIKNATIEAIKLNHTHYGSNRGLLKLRELIGEDIKAETGVSYDPETEIVITSSGAEAINNAILALVDEGDEVIVFTPAFVSYENLVKLCLGIFVDIPLKPENGFQIDTAELRAKITPATKMIIMNNPSNPTGAVSREEILREVAEIAVEHNLLVLTDEMYSKLTYEGTRFHSIAAFPGMKERTVMINGFSKTYAMTGWRLGYIAADARLIGSIMKVHQYSTTCSPTFIQVGLAGAMTTERTKKDVDYMIGEFGKRRKLILKGLDGIRELSYVTPYGAFYVMVDVSATGLTGEEFAARLIDEKYVATVPAVSMGKECRDYIRISFAASEGDIKEGIERIREFCRSLKGIADEN